MSKMSYIKHLTVLSALLGLTGCPDPEGEFDAFGERYNAINPSSGSGSSKGPCTPPAAGEADGEYLFALSAQTANPKLPVLFATTLTTEDAGGELTVSFAFDPLNALDRQTKEGPVTNYGPFAVDGATGAFVADLGVVDVPGAADPILLDTPITASVLLDGFLCASTEFFCGAIEGEVTDPAPIPLEGSSFTFEKVADGEPYPDPPKINCSEDLADPAPVAGS